MRNKKLWKNLMLVTTLTVALGTVSATALAEDDVTLAGGTQVTAFASEGDIDGGIAVETQAEQTAPEAEQTTPEADATDAEATAPEAEQTEQTTPEATAPEVGRADSSRSYRTRGSSTRSNSPRGRHNCQGRSFHKGNSTNNQCNCKFHNI